MPNGASDKRFIFPSWANYLLPALVVMIVGGAAYLPVVVGYGANPRTTDVGYQPTQPVPYSHAMHVGQLGMGCRYCHTTVDKTAFAAIPPTRTCMNCHLKIKPDTARMLNVRESYTTDKPIAWVKIHDLPDYAYFNHSAHTNKGVGCFECHGRIDQMDVVYQVQPLSMGWCLDCHRSPESRLRPLAFVTQMDWAAGADSAQMGPRLMKEYNVRDSQYLTNCSACHR